MVGRVEEIICIAYFQEGGTLHDRCALIRLSVFPRLIYAECRAQRTVYNLSSAHVKFAYPKVIAIVEAHVIEIAFAITVAKKERVDISA